MMYVIILNKLLQDFLRDTPIKRFELHIKIHAKFLVTPKRAIKCVQKSLRDFYGILRL